MKWIRRPRHTRGTRAVDCQQPQRGDSSDETFRSPQRYIYMWVLHVYQFVCSTRFQSDIESPHIVLLKETVLHTVMARLYLDNAASGADVSEDGSLLVSYIAWNRRVIFQFNPHRQEVKFRYTVNCFISVRQSTQPTGGSHSSPFCLGNSTPVSITENCPRYPSKSRGSLFPRLSPREGIDPGNCPTFRVWIAALLRHHFHTQ